MAADAPLGWSGAQGPEGNRIAQSGHSRDVVLVLTPGFCRHQVRRPPRQRDGMSGGPAARLPRGRRVWPYVRTKLHLTARQQGDASHDAVLRRVAVPANWRAWRVLVHQRHRKRVGLFVGPGRNLVAQWEEKFRKGRAGRLVAVVGPTKEGDPPASHDASHFKVHELNPRDRLGEPRLLVSADEVVAILKAVRDIGAEQRMRCAHGRTAVECAREVPRDGNRPVARYFTWTSRCG
jgi:hypothetical protein